MGAVLIIRRLKEADTSAEALVNLLCAGVPVRTGIWLDQAPVPSSSKPTPPKRRLHAPWRKKGERPTVADYDAYCQRVLELIQSPHASRAAWLKGGIVWRIMMEITSKFPRSPACRSYMEEMQDGPSGMSDRYQAITLDSEGRGYYDDVLSEADLDIIAGVFRVYTGKHIRTPMLLRAD